MKMKRFLALCLLLVLTAACPLLSAAGVESEFSVPLEEAQQLFASISETPLMACSGAGAWEGRLKIDADGSFTGYYYDADAGDEVVYEVSFFGSFGLSATEQWGYASYGLWVESLNTLQTPGTQAYTTYGDRIVYDEPPFRANEYLLLTLPGADSDAVPEMVQGEIGGTLDEWEDFSRFVTLTRLDDGWGFFADPSDPPAYDLEPLPTAGENLRVEWPGIWKAQDQVSETYLYIFPEEDGVCQAIMAFSMNGRTQAILSQVYVLDEITAEFYFQEGLHAGLVQTPETKVISLTPFSFWNDALGPWEEHIERDYQYTGPLNDPNSQIPASVWELVNNGPLLSETPAPTAAPEQTAAPTEMAAAVPTAVPTAAPTAAPAPADQTGWTGYWMTRDDSLAELIITDNGNGTLHARALFLPSSDFDATLTPQADGSMRFEDEYGALIGVLARQGDALRFTVTGGYAYDDEEATEYQGYYARGFTYFPAVYEEMWYQTPQDAVGTEDDWLGSWTVQNIGGASALRIDRINGALHVDVTLGQYHFSGLGELESDTVLSLYGDDFSCMLLLNRKLNRIAMMEVGSAYEGVYDFAGNAYYGVLIYQKAASSSSPAASQPAPTQGPSGGLKPIPGRSGYLQAPVSRVDATSFIEGKNDPTAYAPFRMTDGEETTAFQFSTKTTRLGDAYLYFDFDAPVTLDELWMKNGFWKITGGNDQYTRNSRVKKMTIFVRPAGSGAYQLLRDVTLKDDGARKDWKVIHLDGAENVTGVRIRIDAIYTGSKFKTDVCISEIMFVQKAK